MDERTIEISEVTLVVSEAGAGGRPLLLLHGFTGARNDFDPVVDDLAAQGWHVVAPDQRGHGGSTKPADEGAYSFDRFAADALELADAVGWDRFVLLGHSMGGMIAQHLVLAAPERVRGLVLMDTSHRHVEQPADLVETACGIVRTHGMAKLVELERALAEDAPLTTPAHERMCATVPGYRERGENNSLASSPAMYAAMAQQITQPFDTLPRLGEVDCPTLVIVGEQDEPFLAPSRAMADRIADASLAVIPDAGHSPQFESPEPYRKALVDFLDALADPG